MATLNDSCEEESVNLDSSSHSCITESSQSVGDILNSSADKFSSPHSVFNDDFSFEHVSEEKIEEFRTLLNEVNDAYLISKINEFILDTIKTKCSTQWKPYIEAVSKSCEIQQNVHLKCKNGEVFNLLGLEEKDIETYTNTSLLLSNKSAFCDHAMEVLRANVKKLKLQKMSLQDEFGVHSMKAMDGVMTEERKKLAELYNQVEELQNEASQLLSGNTAMAEQVATLRQDSARHLQRASFNLLRNKTLYLKTLMSIQKEKMDQSLLMDEDTIRKMDMEGDSLKTELLELSEQLKLLQATLTEYENKEASSTKYKEVVEEYGKLKMQLRHKKETLKMLNDPN